MWTEESPGLHLVPRESDRDFRQQSLRDRIMELEHRRVDAKRMPLESRMNGLAFSLEETKRGVVSTAA
jgi:hypothetical protein